MLFRDFNPLIISPCACVTYMTFILVTLIYTLFLVFAVNRLLKCGKET